MKKKTVLLGITGGIAACRVPDLIKLLLKENIRIIPVMTGSACWIINPKEIEKVSQNQVFTKLFSENFDYKKVLKNRTVDHIEVARNADLAVVVPATANILSKLAHGLADDFLTTALLAVTCPVILCPSMNDQMWSNPVVKDNISKLKNNGFVIVNPVSGQLACGYEGMGKLADITNIKNEIVSLLEKTEKLHGKTVLVTSGATAEKIDQVRIITNRSSGKMGAAITNACYLNGATVIFLRAKGSAPSRFPIAEYTFEKADELSALLSKFVPQADILYHVAAVSDFSTKNYPGKIDSNKAVNLTLSPREKLYKKLKKINPRLKLVLFKAHWQKSAKEISSIAEKLITQDDVDIVVANDVGKGGVGFEADDNEVSVFKKNGTRKLLPVKNKFLLAREIIELTAF